MPSLRRRLGLVGALVLCATVPHSASSGDRLVVFGFLEGRIVKGFYDKLDSPGALTISPDGRHVYVAADGVELYARDAIDGSLALGSLEPYGGADVAITPDGAFVYAATGIGFPIYSPSLNVFARNAVSGELTSIETHSESSLPGVRGAGLLTLSPDAAHLYAAAHPGYDFEGRLLSFARDALTGRLTLTSVIRDGVDVAGLTSVNDLAVSPDGLNLYVSSHNLHLGDGGTVTVFGRDGVTGSLTWLDAFPMPYVRSIAISGDGAQAYVLSQFGDTLWIYERDQSTGLLAYHAVLQQGVGGVDGLDGGVRVRLTPDDRGVLVLGGDTLALFRRDETSGSLTVTDVQRNGEKGLISFLGNQSLVVAPDGKNIYVTGVIAEDGYRGTLHAFRPLTVHCSPAPLPGCREPVEARRAKLTVTLSSRGSSGNRLAWSWKHGDATTIGDFGDPRTEIADYALCLYDGSSPAPVAELVVRAGVGCGVAKPDTFLECWDDLGKKPGLKYKDRSRVPDGASGAKFYAGGAGAARIALKGKGEHLAVPALPLVPPVTAQLQATGSETCWSATYSEAGMVRNDVASFKARSD